MKDNNPRLLNSKYIFKIVLTAFLLSLLVSTATLWIYNNSKNDIFPFSKLENNNEKEIQQIQWEFNSGLSLSNQLNEEVDKIMFVKIDAGYRIENPTGGYHYKSVNGINYNVTGIEAWLYDDDVEIETGEIGEIQRPISGSWRMYIDSSDSNVSDCPDPSIQHIFCPGLLITMNEMDNLNQLYSSFAKDIANIGTFSNITNNGTEEESLLNSEIEILYWKITHVYRDGSFMEFNIFNDTMIIRYTPLEIFLIDEGGVTYGPSTNNLNSNSFKAKIEGSILPNYIDGINSLLSIIVNL